MVTRVTNRGTQRRGNGLESCGGPGRRVSSGLLACLTALVLLALGASSGGSAAVGTPYTVDTTDGTTDGVCGGGDDCSLADAITAANANPGKDTIAFAIPSPPFSIAPTTDLPDITDPVEIDGFSQGGSGYAGPPIVELRGPGSSPGVRRGLILVAGDSTVRGLVVNGFSEQIRIDATAGDGNRIVGNFIGTDVTGMVSAAPASAVGIGINGGGEHLIGGSAETDRNVISGNSFWGIAICGGGRVPFEGCRPGRITIQGNYIGTNKDGTAALAGTPPFGGPGVQWNPRADPGTGPLIVGGDGAGEGNVISGNYGAGLVLSRISGAEIVGNMIGVDVDGEEAVPNGTGVDGQETADTLIAHNVISGNEFAALLFGGTKRTVIQGNKIGVDVDGLEPIPNGAGECSDAVALDGTADALIGGRTAAERNIISGNRCGGILIKGLGTYSRNRIEGNYIG